MNKKAVIIGSGIGGLSCAVRLLSRGFDVIVYEKDSSIGGKVNCIFHEGFVFDLTASLLMMPQPYKEVFQWAGRRLKDYIYSVPLDPLYRVFYSDKSTFDFSSDMKKLSSTIDNISPGDTAGFLLSF